MPKIGHFPRGFSHDTVAQQIIMDGLDTINEALI